MHNGTYVHGVFVFVGDNLIVISVSSETQHPILCPYVVLDDSVMTQYYFEQIWILIDIHKRILGSLHLWRISDPPDPGC
jgi:hypothetical protein